MSKLNHTPGPWKSCQTEPVETELDIVLETNTSTLGWVYSYKNGASNARLIAASPDMLDALIEAYKFYREAIVDYGPCDHAVNICICPIIRQTEKIQEIIESATGLPIEEVLK